MICGINDHRNLFGLILHQQSALFRSNNRHISNRQI